VLFVSLILFFLIAWNVPQQRCADLLGGMDDVAFVGGMPSYFLFILDYTKSDQDKYTLVASTFFIVLHQSNTHF
jgi:hypothetical protein